MLKHGDIVGLGRWDIKYDVKYFFNGRRLYTGSKIFIFDICKCCNWVVKSNVVVKIYDNNDLQLICPCCNNAIYTFNAYWFSYFKTFSNDRLQHGIKAHDVKIIKVFKEYSKRYATPYRFRMDPVPNKCGQGGRTNLRRAASDKGLIMASFRRAIDYQLNSFNDNDESYTTFIDRHSYDIYRDSGLSNYDWPIEHRHFVRRSWKKNKIRKQWMKNNKNKFHGRGFPLPWIFNFLCL